MKSLSAKDWIVRDPYKHEFPGLSHPSRQAMIVEKYIEHQPSYPFLKAIESGLITSQGILLCRHFPTPLFKRMLLNDDVQRCLKRLYFRFPSLSHDGFFSHEDRAMLVDLAKFGIPVYWVDEISGKILQYTLKADKDTGLFVPLSLVETFRKATVLGVYGSNLQEGTFEQELKSLLSGLLEMRSQGQPSPARPRHSSRSSDRRRPGRHGDGQPRRQIPRDSLLRQHRRFPIQRQRQSSMNSIKIPTSMPR